MTSAIGETGVVVGAIDLVSVGGGRNVRDITVLARSHDHEQLIVDRVSALDGINLLQLARAGARRIVPCDRTGALYSGRTINMNTCFCYQDSPRRAHSIAAQGGINSANNYRNDGDSVYRLFYDTVKGGDFRARESNVYRLAQLSTAIIDQCVAQGVPFAREYGGLLDTRSFGGAQVSRTFYARGQTGQQLLLGVYQALERQVAVGSVAMYARHEMLELVVVDGVARGIVTRDMVTGEIQSHAADAVVLDFSEAIDQLGEDTIREGYGNLFEMYERITGEPTPGVPMRIYPAPHCTMGGLWVDYKLHIAGDDPGLPGIGGTEPDRRQPPSVSGSHAIRGRAHSAAAVDARRTQCRIHLPRARERTGGE